MAKENKRFDVGTEGDSLVTRRSADLFNFYKETYGNKYDIKKTLYVTILKEFLDERLDTVITKNCELTLPDQLGVISIRQRKVHVTQNSDGSLDTSKLMINWKATKDLWNKKPEQKGKKFIYHLPKFYYNWHWFKYFSRIKNIHAFSLILSRTNQRKIAKFANNNEYNLEFYGNTKSTYRRFQEYRKASKQQEKGV